MAVLFDACSHVLEADLQLILKKENVWRENLY